jgi:uncharacterized protein GlcG (DUF336 family)
MNPFKSIVKSIATAVFSLCLSVNVVYADQHALFTTQSLTPEIALKAVTAAMQKCRADGYQVAVAVVDRMGNVQALLRDRYAGAHTPETARAKAWTAASFRTNTSSLVEPTQSGQAQSGVRQVPGALMLGGGMLIEVAGSNVAAIGVSGAPGGSADDSCAAAGIAAILDDISF